MGAFEARRSPKAVAKAVLRNAGWGAVVKGLNGLSPRWGRSETKLRLRVPRPSRGMDPIDADSDGFVYDATIRQRPAALHSRQRGRLLGAPTDRSVLGGYDTLALARGFDLDAARNDESPDLTGFTGGRDNPRNWSTSMIDDVTATLRDATKLNRSTEDARRLRTLARDPRGT